MPIKSLGAHVPQNWTRNDDAAQWRVFDYEMCAARASRGAILTIRRNSAHCSDGHPSHLCTGTRALASLKYPDVQSTLRTSDACGPQDVCANLKDDAAATARMGAGTYACATGSFLPATAAERCCPRGGACDDGRPPCPAVVGGSNPTYDTAWNTEAAAKAQPDVPLEIVYTDRAAAVAAAEAEEVPLLLYGWEPDLFTSKDRFARVRMTEYVYCATRTGERSAASAHSLSPPAYRYDYCGAETNLLVQTPVVCDYPIIQTEKIGYHAFEKLTPDAWALASKLSLNFTEIQRLLELQAANDGDDWEAACAWLKETSGEGVWDEWVVRLTWDWGPG